MPSSPLFPNCFSNYIIGDIFFLPLLRGSSSQAQQTGMLFYQRHFFHMLTFISVKITLHIFYKH